MSNIHKALQSLIHAWLRVNPKCIFWFILISVRPSSLNFFVMQSFAPLINLSAALASKYQCSLCLRYFMTSRAGQFWWMILDQLYHPRGFDSGWPHPHHLNSWIQYGISFLYGLQFLVGSTRNDGGGSSILCALWIDGKNLGNVEPRDGSILTLSWWVLCRKKDGGWAYGSCFFFTLPAWMPLLEFISAYIVLLDTLKSQISGDIFCSMYKGWYFKRVALEVAHHQERLLTALYLIKMTRCG